MVYLDKELGGVNRTEERMEGMNTLETNKQRAVTPVGDHLDAMPPSESAFPLRLVSRVRHERALRNMFPG